MTIQRRNHGRGHSYVDTETGQKIPGVTTIMAAGLGKSPALVNWVATTTAEYAIDEWERLAGMKPSERYNALVKARWESGQAAKTRGSKVHKLAQALVHGDRVAIPEGIEGYVEAYVSFLNDFDVQPIEVERTIYSAKHRFCGTLDMIADLLDPEDLEARAELRTRERWLIDIKTSKSGVFGETALQLAPYRFAEYLVDDDDELVPMPPVDRCGVIHVRPNGTYDLVPVQADETEYRAFLYVQQIAQFLEASRDLVGEPIVSPQTSMYHLEKD